MTEELTVNLPTETMDRVRLVAEWQGSTPEDVVAQWIARCAAAYVDGA